jgi:hypothetical protein
MEQRSLHEICRDIRKHWVNAKGPSVYFGAVPYLEAMEYIATGGNDHGDYGLDTAESIVIYFLSNAATFRGPEAKAIKAELKRKYGIK